MRTGHAGIEIIKMFEGFRSEPYLLPAGFSTIGFVSTRGVDGNRVTLEHSAINRDEAEEMLAHDIQNVEKSVGRLIRVALTQNQFDALVSFVYNLGSGRLQSSTLRSKINRADYEGAADEFPKWVKAGGKRLSGLVKRRFVERKLFLL